MKKILLLFITAVMFLATACEDLNLPGVGDVSDVTDKIASIDEQLASMQATLDLLMKTNEELKATIEELKKSGAAPELIAEMQKKQEELEKQIKAVEESIKETKDWAGTTFATLEQQKELSQALASLAETVQKLQENVDGIESSLAKMIEECTTSIKAWVNEQFSGYYTLAEALAALEAMQADIDEGDKALLDEIEALKKELEDMEARLTEAYKKAIEEALKNNGSIPPSVDPGDTNEDIDSLLSEVNDKIAVLERRLDAVEEQLADLVNRVQSVGSLLPEGWFDDVLSVNKLRPYYDSNEKIRLSFSISPRNVITKLAENFRDVLSLQVLDLRIELSGTTDNEHEFISPVKLYTLPISSCTADEDKGTITVDLAVKDIPEEIFINSEMDLANYMMALCISDGVSIIQSDYMNFYPHYDYEAYPYEEFPGYGGSYEYDNYTISEARETWKLDKERFGIDAEDEIISVATAEDSYINGNKWLTASFDSSTGDILVTADANTTGKVRYETLYVYTSKSRCHIHYRQNCESGTINVKKNEFNFTFNGELANGELEDRKLLLGYRTDVVGEYYSVKNEYDWINIWCENHSPDHSYILAKIEFSVEEQRELSETDFREGTVTIMNGLGKTVDIKITQNMLTVEDVTVCIDKNELNFDYYQDDSSTDYQDVTLKHRNIADINDININSPDGFRHELIRVDNMTSIYIKNSARE